MCLYEYQLVCRKEVFLQVSNLVAAQPRNITANSNYNVIFKGSNSKAENMFDEYAPKKLPEGKAIQLVRRPGVIPLVLSIISAPFILAGMGEYIGFSTHGEYKLVDIDPNNLTAKEQKLIRQGKLIDFVPRGYHIENGKVKKNK